jgi:hypothetical protein
VAEAIVFSAIEAAANDGLHCPRADDLAEMISVESVSTTVGIVNRLERKGLITVERFQKSRRVTIVATGKMTAEPANRTPHWRTRPHNVPSPSLTTLRQRNPDVAQALMIAARHEGRALNDFLADLVWEAWEARSIQQRAEQG